MNKEEFFDKYGTMDTIESLALWITMMEELTERVEKLERELYYHRTGAAVHLNAIAGN